MLSLSSLFWCDRHFPCMLIESAGKDSWAAPCSSPRVCMLQRELSPLVKASATIQTIPGFCNSAHCHQNRDFFKLLIMTSETFPWRCWWCQGTAMWAEGCKDFSVEVDAGGGVAKYLHPAAEAAAAPFPVHWQTGLGTLFPSLGPWGLPAHLALHLSLHVRWVFYNAHPYNVE